MAKKIIETIYNCSSCIYHVKHNDKLHCKNMIKDINEPLTVYSEVVTKKDCIFYKCIEK